MILHSFACVFSSEVVIFVRGFLQKEQLGAEVIFLRETIILTIHVAQKSWLQPVLTVQFLS